MTDVLQQQLRNAGQAVGGTGELLAKAADEIARLKRDLNITQKRAEGLEVALRKVRDDLGKTIFEALGGE